MKSEIQERKPLIDRLIQAYQQDVESATATFKMLCDNQKLLEAIGKVTSNGYMRIMKTESEREKQLDDIIKHLDSKYWEAALKQTGMRSYLPVGNVRKFSSMESGAGQEPEVSQAYFDYAISYNKCPKFDEYVEETLLTLISGSEDLFTKRVDELFHSLSKVHKTNSQWGFQPKGIYEARLSATQQIRELRVVIGRLIGNIIDGLHEFDVDNQIDYLRANKRGEWVRIDGGALQIRCYANGNIHFRIHPEVVYLLNNQLAKANKYAIPSEFRTKPEKVSKEFQYLENTIPFVVRSQFTFMHRSSASPDWATSSIDDKSVKDEFKRIIEFLGGKFNSWFSISFDYDFTHALQHLRIDGTLPHVKSHQYYPTPESLAKEAVAWAEIKAGDKCLEPSAGQGGIAKFMPKHATKCVEISPLHCEVLKGRGFYDIICGDFITAKVGSFDKIVMNPPFDQGRAELHVTHAVRLLNAGGCVVAIVPASFHGKQLIKGYSHEWREPVSFEGVSIQVAMVKISKDKP
jgi:hypothetical protein